MTLSSPRPATAPVVRVIPEAAGAAEPDEQRAPGWREHLDRLAGDVAADDPDVVLGPLLAALREAVGLDVAFLTRIDWDDEEQEIVAASHGAATTLDLDVGQRFGWGESLCRRALRDDVDVVVDARRRWPEVDHGIRAFAMAPIQLPGTMRPWGTLCAASAEAMQGPAPAPQVMFLLARIVGDALAREAGRVDAERRAAEAERRLRERLRFLASGEHAMKGPLTVIEGWARMLEDHAALPADALDRAVEQVGRATQRLRHQLEDLLAASRATLLDVDLDPVPIALHDVTAEVAAGFGAGPELAVVVQGEPVTVATDPNGVRLVLEHLLDNARHHTPAGTTVTVTTRAIDDGAELVVADDGPGLPEGVDVFAPFVSTGDGGSGLGLAIVATLAEALGGAVAVAPSDRGAAFVVRLPDRAAVR